MLKNYLKIALRSFVSHKVYTFINIAGLAIGLACSVLIYLFVRNELSYDRFHARAANLYRVNVTEAPPDRDPFSYPETPARMAWALEQSFPEVKRAVRYTIRTDMVRQGTVTFTERVHLADPDFFEMFSFPLRTGEPGQVLQDRHAVVLSERAAAKYFADQNPVGKQLAIKLGNEFHDFTVSGIAQNAPPNSSIQFDFVIPFDNIRLYLSERELNAWFMVFLETFVELNGPLSVQDMQTKLAAVVKKHYPPESAGIVTLHLQPLTDIHLNTAFAAGFEPTSNPVYSYILIGIGLLVLGIACINFTTLAIGRSAARSREVGVRKVLGAVQHQLVKQFWGEALLLSFFALALGVLLAALLLPSFNALANQQLVWQFDATTALTLIGLTLATGILAGSYPALVISRLRPAMVIKGESRIAFGRTFSRALVVLQFALSIFLVISTLIMGDQLRFLQTKELGFNKEQVVVLRNNSPAAQGPALVERFRNALSAHDAVLGVAGSSGTFGRPWTVMGFRDAAGEFRQFFQQTVDVDYLPTLQIELVAGRNFSREFSTDSSEALIVNESAAAYFGWDDAVGKRLPGPKFPPHRVIGVVRDFNFESLENEVRPLVMVLDPRPLFRGINDIGTSDSPRAMNYINVRIRPDNIQKTVALLKKTWQQVAQGQPFAFSFLEENVEQQYREIERWGRIVGRASALAILIACLGLFGLATLTAVKRTREIGIRKVLGATVPNVVLMLSGDFARLVLLANVLAWPAAFYAMRFWQQDFAYRAGIGFDRFVLAALLALAIALITISYQSTKAALANPANSLKYE